MRCARCGRWNRKLRAGRGPDGRLVIAWCSRCLAEVHLRALGLLPDEEITKSPSRDSTRHGGEPSLVEIPIIPGAPGREERVIGLRGLGALLVVWGLLLELVGAGSWLGFGPPDDGFGPTRIKRMQVFLIAGSLLAIGGAWLGLSTVDRTTRRRALARAVEAAAVGIGLCVLAVGIIFHDPKRDPWVIAGVALAVVSARMARYWSKPRGSEARALPWS
jgi:hypothetical protein